MKMKIHDLEIIIWLDKIKCLRYTTAAGIHIKTYALGGFYGFKYVCSIHPCVKYSTNGLHTCYLVGNLRTSICPLNGPMFQIIVASNNWIPILMKMYSLIRLYILQFYFRIYRSVALSFPRHTRISSKISI